MSDFSARASGDAGLSSSQVEVARRILTLPESRAAGAALGGGAAMILLGLVHTRRTPDIDIHLPTRAATVRLWARLLRTWPLGRGFRVERRFRSDANWWTLTVRTPADESVKVDIGAMLPVHPAAMVRLGSSSLEPGPLVFVDAHDYGLHGVEAESLVPVAPLRLAKLSNPATRRSLAVALSRGVPPVQVSDELVDVTHPKELIFRKAHSVLFKPQRRHRASDLVDIDALLHNVGPQSLISLLQEGGFGRRLSETQLRVRLAKEIAFRLAIAVRDEDYPLSGEELSAFKARLERWSVELLGSPGALGGPAGAPTHPLRKGSDEPRLRP